MVFFEGENTEENLMLAAHMDTMPVGDLSVFLKYDSKNSFSYGIPCGSKEGGGAHQLNEHIRCDILLDCAKILAIFLMDL